MTDFKLISLISSGVLVLLYAPFAFAPKMTRKAMKAFPRSRIAAGILTAIDIIWVSFLLFNTHLGRVEFAVINRVVDFEQLKTYLFVLAPVSFFLIVVFVDELLAPRALGGLLLLLPAPILAATDQIHSPIKLLMVVLAYILVIKGTILVLSPHLFRKFSEPRMKDDRQCRIIGAIGLALAVLVAVPAFL